MAIITAYEAFDIDKFDFTDFRKAVVVKSADPSNLFYVYPKPHDGESPAISVGGESFQYVTDAGGATIPISGDVHSLFATHFDASHAQHLEVQIDGLDISISEIIGDALTKNDQSDDKATIAKAFAGVDFFYGSEGADDFAGFKGADVFFGGKGADHFDGGAGADVVSYATAAKGLTLDLSNIDNNTRDAEGDSYAGVEKYLGTDFGDGIKAGIRGSSFDGLGGDDTLTGNAGADTFNFSTGPGKGNVDAVVKFTHGADHLAFDDATFTALAAGKNHLLLKDEFTVGASATNAGQHLIYDRQSGDLFYDADGDTKGGVKALLVAHFDGSPDLQASDVLVV